MNSSAKAWKAYEKPTVTQLTREQAEFNLLGHRAIEDEGAGPFEAGVPDLPGRLLLSSLVIDK
jgi:hypothetical protein